MLGKYSGTSTEFRSAIAREIQYFITELAEYLQQKSKYVSALYRNISKAMITIVFNAGQRSIRYLISKKDNFWKSD